MLLNQTDGPYSPQNINFGGNDKFNHSNNWHIGNIIHKIRESCYETQIVYLCSGNMGITICKTALVTKTLKDICQAVYERIPKWYRNYLLQIMQIII